MLLSEGRSRVRRFTDSVNDPRFSDADIDDALKTAQLEAWQFAVAQGTRIFQLEASVTTSGQGVADLTTIKPIDIINVSLFSGSTRLVVSPCRHDEAPTFVTSALTLKIVYVPRVSFPAGPSSAFVWGTAAITSTDTMDSLMCAIAASELKVTEAEVNAGLEARKNELKVSVASQLSIPGWSVRPLDSFTVGDRDAGMSWLMTAPDTLQLARV